MPLACAGASSALNATWEEDKPPVARNTGKEHSLGTQAASLYLVASGTLRGMEQSVGQPRIVAAQPTDRVRHPAAGRFQHLCAVGVGHRDAH